MTCDPRVIVQRPQRPVTITRMLAPGAVVAVPLSSTTVVDRRHDNTVIRQPQTSLAVQHPVHHVVRRVERGPQGPPGETAGATFTATAAEPIHGQRAVRVVAGLAYAPDTTTRAHATEVVGIATQSAALNDDVVVRTAGEMTEPSWIWQPGAVYCGTDGQLTQDTAFAGWLLPVGRAITPTTIVVDVDTPVVRL